MTDSCGKCGCHFFALLYGMFCIYISYHAAVLVIFSCLLKANINIYIALHLPHGIIMQRKELAVIQSYHK